MTNRGHILEENFVQLFQLQGSVPLPISSIWLEAYIPLGALVIYKDGTWRSYMPKEVFAKTAEEGLHLYSNKKEYARFRSNLTKSFQTASDIFASTLRSSRLTHEGIEACFDCIRDYIRLYQKTEFFYTDAPFEQRGVSQELQENLSSFGTFKLRARERLNKLLFGKNAYVNRLLDRISKELRVPIQDLQMYTPSEMLDAYSKELRLTKSALEDRRKVFFSRATGGGVIDAFGEEAERQIAAFHTSRQIQKDLRGTVANRGYARGHARVFNFTLEEFDEIYKLVDAMREGEVLVADTTAPEIILACKKAAAIVTNQGGMMSHAAVVSRELGVPCIVGTHHATLEIQTGDLVEVDAERGVVKVLQRVPN